MKQKEYKFIAHITHKDLTTEDNMFIDYTASARCRAKKLAQRPDIESCLLYTSPSPRDGLLSRMPSSA